ncbi:XrtA/PEP-CTERM system TPR-repeat protein PrsT [Thalassotalea euphylliae]|uniref:XrtA/PEP-CTERM system TPR-repeat protein PrsT n=1 Tax=Thalassotalea euphylliae TaxID=1655234 RepID=UPI003641AFCF
MNIKSFVVAGAIGILAACTPSQTVEELKVSANSFIQQGDFQSAIIDLKNAVQQSPRDPSLRLTLGQSYTKLGFYLEAEKEFEKALDLGGDYNVLLTEIAYIKMKLLKAEDVTDIVNSAGELSNEEYAKILLYAGIVSYSQLTVQEAQDFFGQVLAVAPSSETAVLSRAYLAYIDNDYTAVLDQLDSVEMLDSKPLFLLIKASALAKIGQHSLSADAYVIYQELVPFEENIRLVEVEQLIQAEEIERADQRLKAKFGIFEEEPKAHELNAQISFVRENYEAALQQADKALQLNKNYFLSNVIAGLSAYKLGNLEQSYSYLKAVDRFVPFDHPVKRVYASVKLQLGYSEGAADLIGEIDQLAGADTELLFKAGHELLKIGEIDKVRDILEMELPEGEDSPEALLTRGYLKVASNDFNGVKDIEKAIESGADQDQSKILLATAYLSQGDIASALGIAKEWQREAPDNINANVLLAKIHDLKGEKAELAKLITKIETLNPNNLVVLRYRALQALENKEMDKAEALLANYLEQDNTAVDAHSLYYSLLKGKQKQHVAIEKVNAAWLEQPDNVQLRYTLAKMFFAEERYQEAYELLMSNSDMTQLPANYWLIAANSALKFSDYGYDVALEVYDKWISVSPEHNRAWYGKLELLEKGQKWPEVIETAKKFSQRYPANENIALLLPYYLVVTKDYQEAEKVLSQLSDATLSQPFAAGLVGQVAFSKGNYQKALPDLLSLYRQKQSPKHAGLVYTSYYKLGQIQQAVSFIEEHLTQSPNDVITKSFYGQLLLDHDHNKAERVYQELLALDESNMVFLNNSAWVKSKLGKQSEAKAIIERAVEVAPENPIVLDTYGMILIALNQYEDAQRVLEKAISINPDNASVKRRLSTLKEQL